MNRHVDFIGVIKCWFGKYGFHGMVSPFKKFMKEKNNVSFMGATYGITGDVSSVDIRMMDTISPQSIAHLTLDPQQCRDHRIS